MPYKDQINNVNFKELIQIYDVIYKYKNAILKDFLNDKLNNQEFYSYTSLLTPQSRSPLWEKAFICKINAKKIPASAGKGDLLWENKYYEYKVSGLNAENMLHVVQIRIWQDVNYIIQYISKDFEVYTFMLTHSEMVDEIKQTGATAAHGTKKANISNKNIEYRFTIKKDSVSWKRWVKKYKTNLYEKYNF